MDNAQHSIRVMNKILPHFFIEPTWSHIFSWGLRVCGFIVSEWVWPTGNLASACYAVNYHFSIKVDYNKNFN
jgi:hypothetical protein